MKQPFPEQGSKQPPKIKPLAHFYPVWGRTSGRAETLASNGYSLASEGSRHLRSINFTTAEVRLVT